MVSTDLVKTWADSKWQVKITTTTVLTEEPVKEREGRRMTSKVEISNVIIAPRPIFRTQLFTPISSRSILKDPTVNRGLHLQVVEEEADPEKM